MSAITEITGTPGTQNVKVFNKIENFPNLFHSKHTTNLSHLGSNSSNQIRYDLNRGNIYLPEDIATSNYILVDIHGFENTVKYLISNSYYLIANINNVTYLTDTEAKKLIRENHLQLSEQHANLAHNLVTFDNRIIEHMIDTTNVIGQIVTPMRASKNKVKLVIALSSLKLKQLHLQHRIERDTNTINIIEALSQHVEQIGRTRSGVYNDVDVFNKTEDNHIFMNHYVHPLELFIDEVSKAEGNRNTEDLDSEIAWIERHRVLFEAETKKWTELYIPRTDFVQVTSFARYWEPGGFYKHHHWSPKALAAFKAEFEKRIAKENA